MCMNCIGSWVHSGYHLTTSIVAPPLLSLPYAFTFLGWIGGIVCLAIGALVTFYSYNLISMVLERHTELGRRHLRFRDMAHDILGTQLLYLPTSISLSPSLISNISSSIVLPPNILIEINNWKKRVRN